MPGREIDIGAITPEEISRGHSAEMIAIGDIPQLSCAMKSVGAARDSQKQNG